MACSNEIKLKKKKISVGQIILNVFFVLICAAVVFPLWMVISVSMSAEKDILEYGYSIIPKNIDFSAYGYIFENADGILQAYKVTATFSIITMVLAVLLMSMIAYVLSRKDVKYRGKLSFYLYFTMLFNGGLVPSYILITNYLHLDNTIWVYILPALISPWYIFMMRTFFQGIPTEISESVEVDGGNVYTIFFKIILPLSKPVLAVVALYTFLAQWNNWYTAMLYIDEENLISLQYMLQRILQNIDMLKNMNNVTIDLKSVVDIPTETVRMAMAIVVAGPALVIFPFFQKYFVRGLTVGGVKG